MVRKSIGYVEIHARLDNLDDMLDVEGVEDLAPAVALNPGPGGIIHQGWMHKEGAMVKNWKKRWFTLKPDAISYYVSKDKTGGKPKGSVPMQQITHCMNVLAGGKDKHKAAHTLEVGTEGGRIYYFKCEDDDARVAWVKAINDAMVAFFDGRGAGGAGGQQGLLTDGGYA